MRYAQGGGLTDKRRAFREKLRSEAAVRFAQGEENTVIAHDLRVSVRSVQRWYRACIKSLIGRRFHRTYTVQGVAALLKRHGWSCQVPARRGGGARRRRGASRVKETWPNVEGPRRRSWLGPSSRIYASSGTATTFSTAAAPEPNWHPAHYDDITH